MKTKLLVFLILFAKISHSQYLFTITDLTELSNKKVSDFRNFVIGKGYKYKREFSYGNMQRYYSDSTKDNIYFINTYGKITNITFISFNTNYINEMQSVIQNDTNDWKIDPTHHSPVHKATKSKKNKTTNREIEVHKKYIKGDLYVIFITRSSGNYIMIGLDK